MTLDEHILRITALRSPPRDLASFALATCMMHAGLCDAMKNQGRQNPLPVIFNRLVSFFEYAPEEVKVLEAIKLGVLSESERERVAKCSWFEFSAELHTHVSLAYESAQWLGDPYVITDAGPDMPEDGWQGAPVCFATAINTLIEYAKAKGTDLANELDDGLKAR